MSNPTYPQCEYIHWWRRNSLRTRNEHHHELKENASLPHSSVLLSSDFDTNSSTRPPSYQETIDLEKALRLFPTPPKSAGSDDTARLSPPASADTVPPGTCITCTSKLDTSRPARYVRIIRHLRYSVFTVYRRLFTFVFVLNSIGTLILVQQHAYKLQSAFSLSTLAALASANFLLAILVRQDFLVNLLFRTAWLVPWYVPLRIRKIAARVYCYGGIHSGAAIAGTLWWVAFTVVLSCMFAKAGLYMFTVLIVTWVVLILLVIILLLALPSLRSRYHNTFEITHRFLGWTCIALFWTQLLLLTHHDPTASSISTVPPDFLALLLQNPTFYSLSLITLLLVYPWLRLRRWTFTATPLSSHALMLSFPHPMHKFSCLSISTAPLREWHPFATFPSTDPSHPGASMVVSSAGNWTSSLIENAQWKATTQLAALHQQTGRERGDEGTTKMRFWVKGHPKAGVLSLSVLFPRVVILTTGSGIGPALSSLLDRPLGQFARLIWSTRAPVHTYGKTILKLAEQADPEALVIDTSAMGRPDLLQVALRVYQEVGAEAVFVLSNETVTRMLVGGLEKRGVVAFGPIWDS